MPARHAAAAAFLAALTAVGCADDADETVTTRASTTTAASTSSSVATGHGTVRSPSGERHDLGDLIGLDVDDAVDRVASWGLRAKVVPEGDDRPLGADTGYVTLTERDGVVVDAEPG